MNQFAAKSKVPRSCPYMDCQEHLLMKSNADGTQLVTFHLCPKMSISSSDQLAHFGMSFSKLEMQKKPIGIPGRKLEICKFQEL